MASKYAEKNVKDLQSTSHLPSNSNAPVNKLDTRYGTAQKSCYRCGDKHKAADCHFKAAECCKCRKKGHNA